MFTSPFAFLSSVKSNFFLDLFPGAAAAYSPRKLSSAYAGAAFRVRRSSDGTEQDIGFIGEDLDTAAITSFVSGVTGSIRTWYDQSGNGNNVSQTNLLVQPLAAVGGNPVIQGSKPAVDFLGGFQTGMNLTSTNYLTSNPVSLFFVTTADNPGDGLGNGIFNANTQQGFAGSNGIRLDNFSGNARWGVDGTFTSVANNVTATQIRSAFATANEQSLYLNGVLRVTGAGNVPNFTSVTQTVIGRMFDSVFFNGRMQDCIIYNSDQTSNRVGIESNINDYYSIF